MEFRDNNTTTILRCSCAKKFTSQQQYQKNAFSRISQELQRNGDNVLFRKEARKQELIVVLFASHSSSTSIAGAADLLSCRWLNFADGDCTYVEYVQYI